MTKRTGSLNKHRAELQGQCLYCYGMLLIHCCWVLLAECACKAGHPGLIPGSGRSPGEGNVNPLQYSCLENPMDRGALQATVHGVTIVGHDLVTTPPPIHCSWEHPTGVNCLDDRCWKERKLLAKIPFWENNGRWGLEKVETIKLMLPQRKEPLCSRFVSVKAPERHNAEILYIHSGYQTKFRESDALDIILFKISKNMQRR